MHAPKYKLGNFLYPKQDEEGLNPFTQVSGKRLIDATIKIGDSVKFLIID